MKKIQVENLACSVCDLYKKNFRLASNISLYHFLMINLNNCVMYPDFTKFDIRDSPFCSQMAWTRRLIFTTGLGVRRRLNSQLN